MVQRIQRMSLDVIEVKSDFLYLQHQLVDIKDELHSLKTKDQKLEEENAELKQQLKAIYTRYQTDELTSKYFENLKTENLALKIKYDNMAMENNAFQSHPNQMNEQIREIDDLSTRLNIVEGSMQNLFLSVNASFENNREDLNVSCTPNVTGSSECFSGSGVTLSSTTETTTITTPATTQVPTTKGTEPNLNPTTTPQTTQVPTTKGTEPNLNPTTPQTTQVPTTKGTEPNLNQTTPQTTQVPTTKDTGPNLNLNPTTTPAATQVPTSKGTEPNLNPTTTSKTTQVPTSKAHFISRADISVGSRGTEFLILFMRNLFSVGSLTIYVASDRKVMVDISSSPELDATIKSAVDRRLNITHDSKFTFPPTLACQDGTVEPKAVIVQTSELSVVTIFDSFDRATNDGTLIIPTNKLSKKYFVSSTQPYSSSPSLYSQFAVGALYNGTDLNVTFKMKDKSPMSLLGDTYRDGDVFSLTLERLETFQIGHTTDLSSTVITFSKPVAVFSGNRCNQLKSSSCSHILTQLPPISELDNQYVVPSFYNNTGTLIQVISEKYKNVEVTSNEITVLLSDRPVLVTAFGMGTPYGGNEINNNHDSYMTVIPGVHQYLNYYKVVVPGGYDENFLCVMISSEFLKSLRINGYTVDHYEKVYQGYAVVEKRFLVSTFKVQNRSFELTTLDKSHFGLLVYGHRRDDGMGSLETLSSSKYCKRIKPNGIHA
ncbi:uncharacterized protein LOC130049633 [Ostrea edulis]|uniref:uncharacterized protein LOC130049633 n=1 Tax=Ostrea edulis TaxID=37623 RepID=UPI0024AE9639|nr:uncharacterized protein LOC130049633 [Ostrea edulis]